MAADTRRSDRERGFFARDEADLFANAERRFLAQFFF